MITPPPLRPNMGQIWNWDNLKFWPPLLRKKQGLRWTRQLRKCTNWKVNIQICKLAKASNKENWSVQLVSTSGLSSRPAMLQISNLANLQSCAVTQLQSCKVAKLQSLHSLHSSQSWHSLQSLQSIRSLQNLRSWQSLQEKGYVCETFS